MKSFRNALRGLWYALREERHMRFHLCAAFYVVTAGFVTRLEPAEWAAALGCCGLVLGAESFNTALERLCDRVSPAYHPLIGRAKDAAAGAVLACALFAAAAGLALFFSRGRPRLAWEFFRARPWAAALFVLSILLWIPMIRGRGKND